MKAGEPHVAVLGGGYAGMAAATTLAHSGVRVSVFEAGRVLGGRARKVEYDGVVLDNGLHILIGACRETLRLLSLVADGKPPALQRLPLHWEIGQRFRLKAARLPAPLDFLCGLAFARGAAVDEKLRAVRLLARGISSSDDSSVRELLDRSRQGSDMKRYFWEPLCVAALNTPVEIASAQVFLNVLHALRGRGNSDLVLPREDLTSFFPGRAALFVEKRGGTIYLDRRVVALARDARGFVVHTTRGDYLFSQIICALPPYLAAPLVASFPELAETELCLQRFEYQPIYSVYFKYPETTRLPFAMLGLSNGPGHWVFDRGQLCDQHGLFGVVISAQGTHQSLSHNALASEIDAQLERAFPALPRPVWSKVIAEKRATFSCTPGLVRPANKTRLANFYLAGDYTATGLPATIESAVRSGIASARVLLEAA